MGSITEFVTTVAPDATTIDSGTCLPVQVLVQQDTFTIDELSIGIAFLVGLIVGTIIAIICAKLCFKDVVKQKYQDAEKGYMAQNQIAVHDKKKLIEDDDEKNVRGKSAKKKRRQSAKQKRLEEEEPLVPIIPVTVASASEVYTDPDPENRDKVTGQHGLVNALEKKTNGDAEEEITGQDMDSVNSLERELKEESILTMIQLLRTLLGQQMQKGKVGKDQVQNAMKDMQDHINNGMNECQTERDDNEQELRKKIKDPIKLQDELDRNHSKYMMKLNLLIQREKENTRKHLTRNTDLSESEIEALLAQFSNNMANMEHKLGLERGRQAAHLEERLARRRLQLQQQKGDEQWPQRNIEHRREVTNNVLTELVDQGKIMDRQKEELLKQHGEDLNRINSKHSEEYEKQKLDLAEKLKLRREEQARKLAEKQTKDKDEFLKRTDKMTDSKDLLDKYHSFQQQQRDERDDFNDELDQDEAEQFSKLRKVNEKEIEMEVNEKQEQFHDSLQQKAQMSDMEIDRVIRIHGQEMDEFERLKKEEKKRMRAKMQEKIAQRQAKIEKEQQQTLAEQQTIKEQQDLTIKNVLGTQIDLSNDSKEKIMQEHTANMSVINNQLQMSKLRQSKALEAKLAKRKAKVEDLKQKQEDLRNNKKEMKQKERDKQEKDLAKQIADEEKNMEEERKNMVNSLKERLAEETAEALKEQEKQMGELIARLEVGQARRQAIIQKQDKAIKNLEDQIANKVTDNADRGTDAQVDYLLQEHKNQVTHLGDQLQDAKERQEQILREKLEAKKIKREREVESNLENDAAEDWRDAKQRGAGLATALFSQALLESRHKMAMGQLEKEMQVEMQKQRDELNAELEQELQRELEEQKKSFLAQVAAIGKLSKAEVNELVEGAVADTGGTEKEAKKLSKEMRQEMQRAKTDLGIEDDPYQSMKRTKTGYGHDEVDYDERPRPKSSKKRPKSAFKE